MNLKMRALLLYLNIQNKLHPMWEMTPEHARKVSKKGIALAEKMLDEPVSIFSEKTMVVKSEGLEIPVCIYKPVEAPDLPIIIYFHGGGYVLNDIDCYHSICRRIAQTNGAIVISVGYRLAPEHKFPAAHDDCWTVTQWAYNEAAGFGGNSKKMVVMGDSAGGNLAACVAIKARENKLPLLAQVLIYPGLDFTMQYTLKSPYRHGYLLTEEMMKWFEGSYRPSTVSAMDKNISPFFRTDLEDLPPALIQTAEYDPLKEEGKLYADRLHDAGNTVTYKDYRGLVHGFIYFYKLDKEVRKFYEDIQVFLKGYLYGN